LVTHSRNPFRGSQTGIQSAGNIFLEFFLASIIHELPEKVGQSTITPLLISVEFLEIGILIVFETHSGNPFRGSQTGIQSAGNIFLYFFLANIIHELPEKVGQSTITPLLISVEFLENRL
jgi:hypothetical protein